MATTIETANTILKERDSFAAIAYINSLGEMQAMEAYHDLALHLYNEEHDVGGLVTVSRAGIQYGLMAAESLKDSDPTLAEQLRAKAKGLAYNLAANTWPGWDDPVSISAGDMTAGLDAARANLRLADELNKDDLPRSRAYWMLGAQLLAHRRFGELLAAFGEAARYAGTAGAPGEELLSAGFQIMAAQLGGLELPAGLPTMEALKAKLADLEDGPMFAGQIDTALRVFSAKEP